MPWRRLRACFRPSIIFYKFPIMLLPQDLPPSPVRRPSAVSWRPGMHRCGFFSQREGFYLFFPHMLIWVSDASNSRESGPNTNWRPRRGTGSPSSSWVRASSSSMSLRRGRDSPSAAELTAAEARRLGSLLSGAIIEAEKEAVEIAFSALSDLRIRVHTYVIKKHLAGRSISEPPGADKDRCNGCRRLPEGEEHHQPPALIHLRGRGYRGRHRGYRPAGRVRAPNPGDLMEEIALALFICLILALVSKRSLPPTHSLLHHRGNRDRQERPRPCPCRYLFPVPLLPRPHLPPLLRGPGDEAKVTPGEGAGHPPLRRDRPEREPPRWVCRSDPPRVPAPRVLHPRIRLLHQQTRRWPSHPSSRTAG